MSANVICSHYWFLRGVGFWKVLPKKPEEQEEEEEEEHKKKVQRPHSYVVFDLFYDRWQSNKLISA